MSCVGCCCFFFLWENQRKMGILFCVVLFWVSKRREEMLSPRKAEHSECEPECFLPPHLTDFQRRPPPQCWETLIPMAPTICGPRSVIPLQLCPACLPGALHLSQSPGYWTSTVWSPLISQPALPDSESSLLALRWCLLIPASLFPALYIRVLPTKADYDREMQDTFSNHQRHYVSIWMHTFVKNWHTILLTMNQSWLGKTRWATSKLVSLWQTDTMKRVLVLLQRKVKERNEFFFPFSWEQRR